MRVNERKNEREKRTHCKGLKRFLSKTQREDVANVGRAGGNDPGLMETGRGMAGIGGAGTEIVMPEGSLV